MASLPLRQTVIMPGVATSVKPRILLLESTREQLSSPPASGAANAVHERGGRYRRDGADYGAQVAAAFRRPGEVLFATLQCVAMADGRAR